MWLEETTLSKEVRSAQGRKFWEPKVCKASGAQDGVAGGLKRREHVQMKG